MRIAGVVGTRPQLIKAAALWPALRAHHEVLFIDTGQHWDEEMAGGFFAELNLPQPDQSLGVGGGRPADQVGRMLMKLAPILEAARPDAVLVFGDTNSTLAGAIAAAQLAIPVAHVEAGLRSFDRRMPEELNRLVVDHLSGWCFAPTPAAVANLAAEGIVDGVVQVGDLMQDLAAATLAGVRDSARLDALRLGLVSGRYLFATVHRAENREHDQIRKWLALLDTVSSPTRPVVLALHPGTRVAMQQAGLVAGRSVRIIAPQGYRTTLALQLHAAAVLTDSGGVQRESAWLDVPCLVLRATTEWVEAVAQSRGRMRVVGLDDIAALAALAEVAPLSTVEREARTRAAQQVIEPAGAPGAILAALLAPGARPGPSPRANRHVSVPPRNEARAGT